MRKLSFETSSAGSLAPGAPGPVRAGKAPSSPWRKLADVAAAYAGELERAALAESEYARLRAASSRRPAGLGTDRAAIADQIKKQLY